MGNRKDNCKNRIITVDKSTMSFSALPATSVCRETRVARKALNHEKSAWFYHSTYKGITRFQLGQLLIVKKCQSITASSRAARNYVRVALTTTLRSIKPHKVCTFSTFKLFWPAPEWSYSYVWYNNAVQLCLTNPTQVLTEWPVYSDPTKNRVASDRYKPALWRTT